MIGRLRWRRVCAPLRSTSSSRLIPSGVNSRAEIKSCVACSSWSAGCNASGTGSTCANQRPSGDDEGVRAGDPETESGAGRRPSCRLSCQRAGVASEVSRLSYTRWSGPAKVGQASRAGPPIKIERTVFGPEKGAGLPGREPMAIETAKVAATASAAPAAALTVEWRRTQRASRAGGERGRARIGRWAR